MADSGMPTSNGSSSESSSNSVQFLGERPAQVGQDGQLGGNVHGVCADHGQPRPCMCQIPQPPPGYFRPRPFLGDSVPTNINTLEKGFGAHPTHPLNSGDQNNELIHSFLQHTLYSSRERPSRGAVWHAAQECHHTNGVLPVRLPLWHHYPQYKGGLRRGAFLRVPFPRIRSYDGPSGPKEEQIQIG